jgi:hypothetical protein
MPSPKCWFQSAPPRLATPFTVLGKTWSELVKKLETPPTPLNAGCSAHLFFAVRDLENVHPLIKY